eukprot:TRINITY_DN1977_c0_g1_i2.p1 TRINITY_DN1977_c0_g1~~TRINITY_DN1977_c0_g1_i2.p1  ORF type:complete len:314 (+),score=55.04 TRINITY_DN1977_c0_g1_i2:93-944(+)
MGLLGDIVSVNDHQLITEITQAALDIFKTLDQFPGEVVAHHTLSKQEIFYKYPDGRVLQAKKQSGNLETFIFATNYLLDFELQPISTLFTGRGDPILPSRQRHKVTLHKDYDGRYTITRHTWLDVYDPSPDILNNYSHEGDGTSNLPVITTQTQENKKPKDIKVVCYNIWNYNRPWLARLDLLIEEIQAESPDILALQEVRYDFFRKWSKGQQEEGISEQEQMVLKSRFQADQFQRKLPGYQFAYEIAMTDLEVFQGGFHVDEGVALFSRPPLLSASALRSDW